MTAIKVSKRLQLLVEWIPRGAVLADIGSDHAYLPSYAVQSGKVTQAIAGEVNQGPYQSACETVESLGLSPYIEVRKGNGLQVLNQGEATTIVIAGMGGSLIRSILDEGKGLLSNDITLILQPNNGEEALRRWLSSNEWTIQKEVILEEDGHVYEALKAVKEQRPPVYSLEDLVFGPFLRQEKSILFQRKWKRELEKWESIYEGIQGQTTHSSNYTDKLEELTQKINQIKEVL